MIIKMTPRRNLISLSRYLWKESLMALLYSALIYFLYEEHDLIFLASFSSVPVAMLGTVLSVFIAFRNNSAWDRWWEGRKIWGQLVNASRHFATQVLTLVARDEEPASKSKAPSDLQRKLILRHVAHINLMRMQLRGTLDVNAVSHLLNEADMQAIRPKHNPANAVLHLQAEDLEQAQRQGLLTDYQMISMYGTIERFYDIIGMCERIKGTPFPREYDGLIRYLIWLVIATAPINLLGIFSDDLSKLLIIPSTIAIALIVGFANKVGEVLEDPFENRVHDIPMTALCDKIEKDLRSFMNEDSAPQPQQVPADFVVW